MTDRESELLSVAATAKLLHRSTEQVRRYLREGELPGRRLGGQWFVHVADAQAFRQRRVEETGALSGLASSGLDPLGAVVAIGGSGGGDIANGTVAYVCGLRPEETR